MIGKDSGKLSILVDLDGVLADFEKKRHDVLVSRGVPAVPPAEVFDFYATRSYTERFGAAHARMARDVAAEPGFFESMDPVPGALEGVDRLLRMGHDVRICSKPLEAHPRCAEEKRAWVRRYLGAWWEQRAIITPRKSDYSADALIDDRPDLRDYMRRRGEPEPVWAHVLFAQPWNADSTSQDFRMVNWSDFLWVEQLVRKAGSP